MWGGGGVAVVCKRCDGIVDLIHEQKWSEKDGEVGFIKVYCIMGYYLMPTHTHTH